MGRGIRANPASLFGKGTTMRLLVYTEGPLPNFDIV